ncbi:EF-hand calcium-binding domain-containing protein 7-like isoform X2 [Littorina saxatilis]|uniref:EF-hand domain-containing protein n=1 Tax=Littorina saxatilis TaxID=31220 RepID=A0AAN9B9I2_9CAEN
MSTGRLSRPSSAASHSSRISHASHTSHVSHASHGSRTSHSGSELKLECKAAYLSVFDDVHDTIDSKQDFILVLQQAGRNPSQRVVNRYWDDDRDSMAFDEFVDVCRKVSSTSEDDLMKAFRKIDINGDGYISLDELYKIMTTKGERLSRQEVKVMIDEVDENKDGRLDYKEFCRMFMSTTEECKKLSLRAMEKKERRKKRKDEGPSAAPRKDKKEESEGEGEDGDKGEGRPSPPRRPSLSSRRSSVAHGDKTAEEMDASFRRGESGGSQRETAGSQTGSRLSLQSQLSVAEKSRKDKSDEGGGKRDVEEDKDDTQTSPRRKPVGLVLRRASVAQAENIGENKETTARQREKLSTRRQSAVPRAAAHLSLQSQQSLVEKIGRTGSRQSLLSIDDLPRPSPRGNKKNPVIGRLQEPSRLRDWHHGKSKGCFFIDEEKGFVSHQYQLMLTEDTTIWLTIQPTKSGSERGVVDTAMYILQDDKDDDDALIAFTEQRDSKGCYGVRCSLSAGTYSLIPFTTGCRLHPRRSEPSKPAKLIAKDKEDKIELTKQFKKALEEIFDMADLDGNGLLSRDEFSWFNIRTSDEQVADDEWQVVEDNVELKNGEITKRGFISLNEMEAQDNDGDTEDLWITLSSMGFNKALEMDEACPFALNVYAEDGEVILKVTELENPGKALENAVCASVIAKGEGRPVKSLKDVTVYTYVGDARATVVVENKSRNKTTLELDCRKSRNCVSNLDNMEPTVTVPGHAKKVGIHLVPEDEREEWSVRCTETAQ